MDGPRANHRHAEYRPVPTPVLQTLEDPTDDYWRELRIQAYIAWADRHDKHTRRKRYAPELRGATRDGDGLLFFDYQQALRSAGYGQSKGSLVVKEGRIVGLAVTYPTQSKAVVVTLPKTSGSESWDKRKQKKDGSNGSCSSVQSGVCGEGVD